MREPCPGSSLSPHSLPRLEALPAGWGGRSFLFKQCNGSVTFWYGSGSAVPCLWLMDPDNFVTDLQDANKKLLFFCLLLFEGTVETRNNANARKVRLQLILFSEDIGAF